MAGRTVTLIIHGTFAAEETWWRLGSGNEPTFADRLEERLAAKGLAGTVWKPALAAGFDYSAFAWTGNNRHRDRVAAGKKVGSALGALAAKLEATPEDPLVVNLVAHSHGGNVVLEALRHECKEVRIGRVAMLGTPLVTSLPAFRAMRLATATIFTALLFLYLFTVGYLLVRFPVTHDFIIESTVKGDDGTTITEQMDAWWLVVFCLPILAAYAWIFWCVGFLGDVLWQLLDVLRRPLGILRHPIAWIRRRNAAVVYGPAAGRLTTRLEGRPLLLLTTKNDEADLMLQLSASPKRVYKRYVKSRFGRIGRAVELVIVRPVVLGIFLPVVEFLLEVLAFGFPAWRALFLDFEVAGLGRRPYYPTELLVRRVVALTSSPAATAVAQPATRASPALATVIKEPDLLQAIHEMVDEIKQQIRLRHCSYYSCRKLVDQLADFISGTEKIRDATQKTPAPAPAPQPPAAITP